MTNQDSAATAAQAYETEHKTSAEAAPPTQDRVLREVGAEEPALAATLEPDSEAPLTPQQKARRDRDRDKRRQVLVDLGITDEAAIEAALAKMSVTTKDGRRLPERSAVCSPERVAYFEGRTSDEIVENALKHCHDDGGGKSPEGCYRSLIEAAGVGPELAEVAARKVAAKVRDRHYKIRVNLVAAVNELRRREAVDGGRDPMAVKYWSVTPPEATKGGGK